MDTSAFLISELDCRWQRYRAQLAQCRSACAEDAIHDVRVSMRRLAALFALTHRLTRSAWTLRMRRLFKSQVARLAELRDTQMMLAEVSRPRRAMPHLDPLRASLRKQEKRQLHDAHARLAAFPSRGIRRGLAETGALLARLTDEAFTAHLLHAVDRAFLKVCRRFTDLDPDRASSVHRMRIAFKKFRYLVESVHPMLPSFPSGNLRRLRAYQSRMGAIQDTEVLLRALEDASGQDATLSGACRHYERRRARLMAAFLKQKDVLFSFWRASPHAGYPWENGQEPGAARKPNRRHAHAARPDSLTRGPESPTSGRAPARTSRRAPRRSRTGRSSGGSPRGGPPRDR